MASKPDFADIIRRHHEKGLGWRYDGVGGWSTAAIFKYLRDLGIDTDEQRFAQQAAEAKGFEELTDKWIEQIPEEKRRPEFIIDFPMVAMPVLWKRLAAHVICADLIEELLYEAINAEE